MKKRTIYIVVILTIAFIIYKLISWNNIKIFMSDYKSYLKGDIKNQISLFESVIGGICAGITTFGALFITILHENKKNRESWEKEKEMERELRLWSIMPVLNLEVDSISAVRNGNILDGENMIQIGNGTKHVYARISMSNTGNGNCRNIDLKDGICSVKQLSKDKEMLLKIFFNGLKDNQGEPDFDMIFYFQDDLGTVYTQRFKCHINIAKKNMKIRKEKPNKEDERK